MASTLDQIGSTFRNQLHTILCGADENRPAASSPQSFITWVSPGMVYDKSDFDFLVHGIGNLPPESKDLTGDAKAAAVRRILGQARDLAMQMDFIPDVRSAYTKDRQDGVRTTDGTRLSQMYKQVLDMARVVKADLTEEQQAKLKKLQGKLLATKKVTNLATDEVTEVTDDSPLYQAYKEQQQAYLSALTVYNNKRTMAMSGGDPVAVTDFSLNGEVYRQQLQMAMKNWEVKGYKNDVELIISMINDLTRKSLGGWRDELKQHYDNAMLNDTSGTRFPYTSLIPAGFAESGSWTSYSMNQDTVAAGTHSESTDWTGGADIGWGFWSAGGDTSGSNASMGSDLSVSSFKMSFELTQTLIVRPGIFPEWFRNQGWDLKGRFGDNNVASDGEQPPNGFLVGYPVQAIWARNVTIESDAFTSHYDQHASSVSGDASVGWGPFSMRGSYSNSKSDENFASDTKGGKVTIPGMQLIAFVNHLLPKSPNLSPEITEDQMT